MPVRVVDASAFAAMAFRETPGAEIRCRLQGNKLIAPGFFPFELTSVCLKKCRARPAVAEFYRQALAQALLYPMDLLRVDHSRVLKLAEKHRISGYDASYLWLSLTTSTALVTLDQKLMQAAHRLGIS